MYLHFSEVLRDFRFSLASALNFLAQLIVFKNSHVDIYFYIFVLKDNAIYVHMKRVACVILIISARARAN